MFSVNKTRPAKIFVVYPSVAQIRTSSKHTEQASVYFADDALLRARSAELARPTMMMRRGDLRFKCGRDKGTGKREGLQDGRRFLSLRKPLTGRTATGERAPGGTHLPFSALTAAQQSSFSLFLYPSFPLAPSLPMPFPLFC